MQDAELMESFKDAFARQAKQISFLQGTLAICWVALNYALTCCIR